MRGSLRLRLLAAGAASILLALALAGFGLVLLFERHVERRMALELEAHLRQLIDGLGRAPDGSLDLLRPPAEPRFLEPLSGLYWQIREEPPAEGGAVLRSRSLWDTILRLPPDLLRDGEVHQHSIPGPGGASLLAVERHVTLPASLGGGGVRAVAAVDRAELHAAGRAFALDLAPSLALLAAILIAAAWVQVTVGLRPLGLLRHRLAAVRAGREVRLGAAGFPDEVRPLAAELDHLLDAQGKALERARARAADLAHGLKTPLTILAADAAQLRERGEGELAEEIETVTEVMRRHVERELARARAAQAGGGAARQAAPAPVAQRVVDVLRRVPRGQDLAWDIDIPAELIVDADAQDLAEMLGNLAENAMKWARGRVRLAGRREAAGGAVLLSVEDDGPGIPETEAATALARGGRLDATKPGAGLGLAIVGDLAEAYGGSLGLGRSAELGGLRAEIRLPCRDGLSGSASAR
ncbi:sensor histidine kinase [Siccirubricoccus sp. G192]|uniref:sensor histidine kinase n=1 Tax=Siccirubricoccus sp. G192 TaxID=2849651 RepID=UPI001C2C4B47|nr:sensor histidine kinase [Siccirubricoccus sp. G192]MBV1796386.1 sensor histidine kinase [Siccirubricoccus sp. G192]